MPSGKNCYTNYYMRNHRKRKYWNLLIVGVSLVVAVVLSRVELFHAFLLNLGDYGYLGAFAAGILFVSTFTVSTGSLVLLILAEKLNLVELGLIAGVGAVVGDLLIFRFVQSGLAEEISSLYNQLDGKHHLLKLFHTKYFGWTLPVLGALIIASPLPDELGVSLLGISKMSSLRFTILSYFLNSAGIILVLSLATIIKP